MTAKNIYIFVIAFCIQYAFVKQLSAQNIPSNPNLINPQGMKEGKWTILFDKDWKEIKDKSQAIYYRLISYKNGKPEGIVTDQFSTGEKQWEGHLVSENPDVNEGLCIWYYKNGKKEQEILHANGYRNGKAIEYLEDGRKKGEGTYKDNVKADDWIYYFWKETNLQAEACYNKREDEKALELFLKSCDQAEKEFGKDHVYYALSIRNAAVLYAALNQTENAISYYKKSVLLYGKIVGKKDPEYINSVDYLAYTYEKAKRYAEEEPLRYELVQIYIAQQGKNNEAYIAVLDKLALNYYRQKKYEKAEPLFEEILLFDEKTTGKSSKAYNTTLLDLANTLLNLNNYEKFEKAEKYYTAFLAYTEKEYGKTADYAYVLKKLSSLYLKRGQKEKAEVVLIESKNIYEKVYGKNHAHYANATQDLGIFYRESEQFQKGEQYLKESCQIMAELVGTTSNAYADYITQLGSQYFANKKYDNAESTFIEALNIYEKNLGKTHHDYKSTLILLAITYKVAEKKEKYDNIISQLSPEDQAQFIEENLLGNSAVNYSKEADMAIKYFSQGEYLKAMAILEKQYLALQVYFQSKKDMQTVLMLQNVLAECYLKTGNINKAEAFYETSTPEFKKVFGEKNPDYAIYLNHLADFYEQKGDLDKAINTYYDALDILEATTDKNTLQLYGQTLGNLASISAQMGYYIDAQSYFTQSLNIIEKEYGKQSALYAKMISNQAFFYLMRKYFSISEPLFKEALLIKEKIYGKEHPEYASTLHGLASMYHAAEKYDKAEPLYVESNRIIEKELGRKSTTFINSYLTDLALLYTRMGKYDKAEPLYKEVTSSLIYQVNNYFPTLSESEKTTFYNTIKFNFNYFNAFAILRKDQSPAILSDMYNNRLATKALLFNSTSKTRQNILNSKDESLKNLYMQWLGKKDFLAKVYQMNDAEKRKQNIDEVKLEEEANILEKQLSQKSELFSGSNIKNDYTWQDVQKQLKENEAAVEIIRIETIKKRYVFSYIGKGLNYDSVANDYYRITNVISERTPAFKAGIGVGDRILEINGNATKGASIDQVQEYMNKTECTFKIQKAGSQIVKTVIVKNDSAFTWRDTTYIKYAALIVKKDTKDNPECIVLENGKELDSRYLKYYQNIIRTESEDLFSYNQYWKQIAEKLPNVTRIYFSPDGAYNKISINTIQNPVSKKYLLDENDIVLVSNTKDIISTNTSSPNNKIINATLLGFPDYTNRQTQNQIHGDAEEIISDTSQRFISGGKVTKLPGTKVEINLIENLLKSKNVVVNKYMEKEATEDLLKKLESPQVLHIATHGFFVSEQMISRDNERGFAGIDTRRLISNPLLRSGILLAGAEQAFTGNSDNSSQTEDGILTAYEAKNLNLDKTELVILSACETGLGEIRNGEGVYGLQRAFRGAGAKTIIMSLWKVNDQATQELMTQFYDSWSKGNSKRDAFTNAQKVIRNKYKSPYYWGAFIMIGN